MRAVTLAVAVVGFTTALACGSGGGDDGSEPECEAVDSRTDYPEGPFGVEEGDIIDNLQLVLPDGGAYSLSEAYQNGSNRLIYLATAAGWCTACIEEQPTLQQWHEDYGASGLEVIVSVFQDQFRQPATAPLAEQWVTQHQVDFTVVADPGFLLEPYYPNGDPSTTPLNLVIDACTMEITRSSTGADTSAIEAIIEGRL